MHRPRFVAGRGRGTRGCLPGDAANALRLWPRRGLNTGPKSALSLAHRSGARRCAALTQTRATTGAVALESGIPLERGVTAWAEVTAPDRTTQRVALRAGGGTARGAFRADQVGIYKVRSRATVWPAASQRLVRAAGAGWLAVGDAALAPDPLSSSGIDFALASAELACATLVGAQPGDENALARYAAAIARDFAAYRALRAQYYGLERRWRDAPFWARRVSGAKRGSEVDAGLEPAAQIA